MGGFSAYDRPIKSMCVCVYVCVFWKLYPGRESFHVRHANAVPNSITSSGSGMQYLVDPLAERPIVGGRPGWSLRYRSRTIGNSLRRELTTHFSPGSHGMMWEEEAMFLRDRHAAWIRDGNFSERERSLPMLIPRCSCKSNLYTRFDTIASSPVVWTRLFYM